MIEDFNAGRTMIASRNRHATFEVGERLGWCCGEQEAMAAK
jgi:hypothetical protein